MANKRETVVLYQRRRRKRKKKRKRRRIRRRRGRRLCCTYPTALPGGSILNQRNRSGVILLPLFFCFLFLQELWLPFTHFLLSPLCFHALWGALHVVSTFVFVSAVSEPGSAQLSELHHFSEQQYSTQDLDSCP